MNYRVTCAVGTQVMSAEDLVDCVQTEMETCQLILVEATTDPEGIQA